MNWLMLAVAPGVAISAYIIFKDEYNREPRKHLIISFLLGAVSIIPAMLLELPITFTEQNLFFQSILGNALKAYFMVALPEEACKYFMLKKYAYRQPEYDEPFDGIVYAVMVGMGFATAENVLYVYQYGVATGIVRMFLAVPAHATFAILMGYFMGKARFETKRESYLLGAGLFWSILFHGSYDFFLFLNDTQHSDNEFSLLLFLGAAISLIAGVVLSKKAIQVHLQKSASTYIINNLNAKDQ